MEPFETLPTGFVVTRYAYVMLDTDGEEIGLARNFLEIFNAGALPGGKRQRSVEHVEDIMDAMGALTYPAPGSLGWATALEDAIRGEVVAVEDAEGWPIEIAADLSDGGMAPPPLPARRPVAWTLRRGGEEAVETGGHVWRTDMAHVMESVNRRLDDEEAKETAWKAGELGCGEDPVAWADAEREAVAWARTWPGGRQTVIVDSGEWASLCPQDLTVATAWAAAHPDETEPVTKWSWE